MKPRTSSRRPTPAPERSPKAGRPSTTAALPARVRRRRISARVAVKKDTMLLQTDDGPRALWAATQPKVKKR